MLSMKTPSATISSITSTLPMVMGKNGSDSIFHLELTLRVKKKQQPNKRRQRTKRKPLTFSLLTGRKCVFGAMKRKSILSTNNPF